MLPLGAQVANLMQTLDACRSNCWNIVQHINTMDKPASEQAFADFKKSVDLLNKQVSELSREAKAYDREYRDLRSRGE